MELIKVVTRLRSVLSHHNHYKLTSFLVSMITYNDLYECLRKERYSEQLQLLPKKFVVDVRDYISEKKKLSSREGDLFPDEVSKIKKQLENSISIFKELMVLRKKKLLSLVFIASETGISKRDFENMLDFEKELFDNIMSSTEYAEKTLASEFSNGALLSDENLMKLVLFLDDVEELVGSDGKPIGPFKKDEIVNIPKQVAEILVSDNKAEVVLED